MPRSISLGIGNVDYERSKMLTDSLDMSWRRYGLIAELAQRLYNVSPQFSKMVLQRMIYLLQEIFDIDCGYDFQFDSCGLFASQLSQDLDLVEYIGGVLIHTNSSTTDHYKILPGKEVNSLRDRVMDFLGSSKVSTALSKLVKEFGHFQPRELELRSTIAYVAHDIGRNEGIITQEKLRKVVKNVKPRFSNAEIDKAIEEMSEKGFVKIGQ